MEPEAQPPGAPRQQPPEKEGHLYLLNWRVLLFEKLSIFALSLIKLPHAIPGVWTHFSGPAILARLRPRLSVNIVGIHALIAAFVPNHGNPCTAQRRNHS